MARRAEHHVVPASYGGWDVKRENAKRASAHTETKSQAVKIGRQISQNQKTELVIHNEDGTIMKSESHSDNQKKSRSKR